MKKIICMFILTISIIALTSCKGYKDINSMNILLGVALDKLEGEYFEITTQTAKTTRDLESKGASYVVETGRGKSIFEAARNLSVDTDGTNYWSHVQTIVLGQKYAEDGIESILDFFTRDSQRRRTVVIIVTDKTAKSLIQNIPKHELNPPSELKNISEQTYRSAYGVNYTMNEFIKNNNSVSGVAVLNHFRSTAARRETKSNKQLSTESILKGVGIFYKYKLVGYLNNIETRHMNILKNNIDTYAVSAQEDINNFTYELMSLKTKLSPSIEDNNYVMNATVNVKANVVEYVGEYQLSKIPIDTINEIFEKEIYNNTMLTFNKAKNEIQLDIFGFGNSFSRKYPEILDFTSDEWNNIFSKNLTLNLTVNVDTIFSGSTLDPLLNQ